MSRGRRAPMSHKEFKELTKLNERGCWIWQRSTRGAGYAQVSSCDDPSRLAGRFSYKLHIGEIPPGMWVLHKCDEPLCVNPKHLFLGTRQDNVDDMFAKGRDGNRKPRNYRTAEARAALAVKYKDPAFRAVQGAKISAGLRRSK